jgi:hypothetical protein
MHTETLENGLAEPQDAARSAMAPTAAPWLSGRALTEQTALDEHLTSLWLHGRPEHTQRAYRCVVW